MTLKLNGSTDGSVSIDAPADTSPTGSDITLTLPTTVGSAEQFLKNSGTAGELEYSSMVETSTGVGIGTTSPSHKCQIAGTLAVDSYNDTTKTITLRPGYEANANGGMGLVAKDHSGAAPDGLGIYGTDGISLHTASAGTFYERMKIESSGRSMFFAPEAVTYIKSDASAGTTHALITGVHGGGSVSLRVWTNGNIQNTNDSYTSLSDIKLKENIVDAGSQWDDFKAVRFRKYNFKEETGHETHTQLGVIAQELELTSPGLVFETADQDAEGNDLGTTTKGVKSSILTKKGLVALQEAMTRIETLEAQNTAQQAQIDDLLARVTALEAAE
jgi:hypothetical protein